MQLIETFTVNHGEAVFLTKLHSNIGQLTECTNNIAGQKLSVCVCVNKCIDHVKTCDPARRSGHFSLGHFPPEQFPRKNPRPANPMAFPHESPKHSPKEILQMPAGVKAHGLLVDSESILQHCQSVD